MTPGTIMDLTKTLTVRGDGMIVNYKLHKDTFVRVLVLDSKAFPSEGELIDMIDAAAKQAKDAIRRNK